MTTAAPTSTNNRTPYLIAITTAKVVRIQAKASAVSAVEGTLGYTQLTETGEIPSGKTLVGKGKAAALANGVFGITIDYAKTATKIQSAKLLCSPTKADTVFTEIKGKTYAGKNIIDARVPRRRIYVF
jgi:hypothetical protein